MNKTLTKVLWYCLLSVVALFFLIPVFIILINSFKSRFVIMSEPFSLPMKESFVGLTNYFSGIEASGFFKAFGISLFVTVLSVTLIIVCSSMTAWYITRRKTIFTKMLYFAFVFSMIVPFQMVMYTLTYVAVKLNFANPLGIVFIYLGFGAGLSVFMFSGFVKGIPREIEEAATIDGCNSVQTFFRVVFPILKSTTVTVAILNAMWIWNDYLLPYLVLGSKYKTIPVAVQLTMQGAYGNVDWGGFMAMLTLSIIPIIVLYIFLQRYIIEGVLSGAVKG
ncbi:MAG: carbohydrate ABC transporter permease [Clostridia bacterium]|nr:carbohydrate ABC transporter permease [Clostridia bacterium]